MSFKVSPSAYMSAFPVPCEAVDDHIRLAGAVQLKVLLAAFRQASAGINPSEISELLAVPLPDVEDALRYWAQAGFFFSEEPAAEKTREESTPVIKRAASKPTREEVIRRGCESEEVAFLLREAQVRFGRSLKTSEASLILWLYDDEGMNAALILMLLEYAAAEGKCTVRFIEQTAAQWIKNGVTDLVSAENQIAKAAMAKTAWRVVESAFGMERRMPSAKEMETADIWVNEWGFSRDILRAAYDKCVDTTSKFSMPYIKKILEKWHKAGVKKVSDIPSDKPKNSGSSMAAYDLDRIEQMLNED